MTAMNYEQTLDYLYNSLPDFHQRGAAAYKPGLERVHEFNRLLGCPDRRFRSVHVAGTNGKGSVSHILASVLSAAGYRVGLYTSPHIKDFRERIRVDGRQIGRDDVVDFVARNRTMMDGLGLSFFEMTVGMAFDFFARSGVDIAVVETGLGGRLDATNIITPVLSVITNIGLDHQALLGDTIDKIAAEKAGIIKRGIPVVVGQGDALSAPVFEARAAGMDAPLTFADKVFCVAGDGQAPAGRRFTVVNRVSGDRFDVELDLYGDYQRYNIVTALAALDVLDGSGTVAVGRDAVLAGCAVAASSTGLHGRWEVIGRSPMVVCDTGHNAHGFAQTLPQLKTYDRGRLFMVLGFVDDKDLSGILPLLPTGAHCIFTQPSTHRALPVERLAALAAAAGVTGDTAGSVPEALAMARERAAADDMIFIGGSNYVVADLGDELDW